jgi:hypothetical protein
LAKQYEETGGGQVKIEEKEIGSSAGKKLK